MSRLTYADAAWLHMELPDNLMMITGLLYLSRAPLRSHMEAVLEHRLCQFERFKMRVRETRFGVGVPHWEPDSDFNVSHHLVYEQLKEKTEAALLRRCGELMSEPLDRERPLWEFRVFPGAGNGAWMVVRLHHAIADGIALMKVLLTLCDHTPDAPEPVAHQVLLPEHDHGGLDAVKQSARNLLHEGAELLHHPALAVEAAGKGLKAGKSLARILSLPGDSPNAFRGELSRKKLTTVSPPYPLTEIKDACRRLDCSLNDLLIAVLAGALGRALRRLQEVPEDLEIRAVVPIDLRAGKSIQELGNQFGLVFLSLPVGLSSVKARIQKVHRSMLALKESAEAVITFELLSTVGALPSAVERPIIEWFGNKATAVVTNLRGPAERLYIGGVELRGIMYWVPQSGRLGLGVSLMSYAGQVRVGVASDANLIPDPGLIIEDFDVAYQEAIKTETL